jgi:hypothetical protein
MAKRSAVGIISLIKSSPRKRPGRHSKKYSKRIPKRKRYRGQGR